MAQRFISRTIFGLALAFLTTSAVAQTGNLTGRVSNALTGQAIAGATIVVNGRTAVTDANGNYDLTNIPTAAALNAEFSADTTTGAAPLTVNFRNLSTDSFLNLSATAAGFQDFTSPVTVMAGTTTRFDFTMIPSGGVSADLRIVLTWGQNPGDLDSHLNTPPINGQSHHIFFANRGSTTQSPFASLDVDDVTSFGPETITITQGFAGTYNYYVHHFSGSSTISQSGARVDVFDQTGLIMSFTPPEDCTQFGVDANWFVFNYDGGAKQITPVQVIQTGVTVPAPGTGCTGGQIIGGNGSGGGSGGSGGSGGITLSYLWNFGDGTTSTQVAPSHTYNNPGTYTVTLQLNTSDGRTDSEAKTAYITVLPPATISVADVSITEGALGTTNNATVTATLSAPSSQMITVNYATSNGSAVTPGDYLSTNGMLTFPSGTTSQTIVVPVLGDDDFEQDETFNVTLSTPSNVSISDGTGVVTILNDDLQRIITIDDVDILEGNPGSTNVAVFTLSLSATNRSDVTVNFTTEDATATVSDQDYTALSGTVTFPPGSLSETVIVPIKGDFKFEPDETFHVNLSSPTGAVLGDSQGLGTIQNDDIERFITVNDISVMEGDTGQTMAIFDVSVNPGPGDVQFDYDTDDGTAAFLDGDYNPVSGSLSFTTNNYSATVAVEVNGDYRFEADETFVLNLSNANGATLLDEQGLCVILNDDTRKVLSIAHTSVIEGNIGTISADFRISLSPTSQIPVTVSVRTSDGTAAASDNDYQPRTGTLTFAPGESEQIFSVTVVGDTNAEPNEIFFANLFDPVDAFLGEAQGVGTILGDEGVTPEVPVITSLSDTNAPIDTQIEIRGRNFSPLPAGNIVQFGAVRAAVVDASETNLTVNVPAGATYAPISVSVAGLSAWSKDPFVVTFQSASSIDQGSFGTRSDLPAGSVASDVVIADLDNDGRSDIASIDTLNSELRVFRNAVAANSASAGIFSAPVVFDTDHGPVRLAAADLNGDGKLDLAVVNQSASTLSIFRNAGSVGSIAFAAPIHIDTPLSPSDLAVGDVNHDGKPELIVSSKTAGRVTIYPNSAPLGLLPASSFTGAFDLVAGTEPSGVRVADLDGDSFVDIAVPNQFNGVSGNRISLFLNTGNTGAPSLASFTPAGHLNTPVAPVAVRIADLDRDGRLDLLTSNSGDATVSAYRNLSSPGSFTFGARQDFDSVLSPRLLGLGDVDGDGLPDLAIADEAANVVRVHRNTSLFGGGGNLTFSSGISFPSHQEPFGAAFGDLDFDGKPELLTSTLKGSISLFRNNTRLQPTVIWNASPNLTYGEAVQNSHYDVTISPDVAGSLLFTPPPGTVLDAGSERTLSVTFVPSDFVTYITVSSNRPINVARADLTITPDNATKAYAEPAPALNATLTGLVNGDTLADLDVPPQVATTAGQFSDVGAYDISASGASDSNYNISYGPTAILTIERATPNILWTSPAPIQFGTALNNQAHLNATVTVPGTLIYTPPAGSFLPLGHDRVLTVNFTPDDTLNYNPASAMVAIDVVKADPVITWSSPSDVTYGDALNSTDHLNASADVPGSFAYNPGLGTVLNAGNSQSLSATFTPTDTANYNTVTTAVTINVLKADPEITWVNPAPIDFGDALNTTDHLNPVTSVAGTFSFAPPAGTVLNAGPAQQLTALFTPSDRGNYNAISVEARIDVRKAIPNVQWNAPDPITHGTALTVAQLNAVADTPGTMVYSPSFGRVLPAGDGQDLTVTFTPGNEVNFEVVTETVSIDVLRATPTITWQTPAPISYGTPVGSDQLNAISTIPGAFDYGDQAGAVLDAGPHQLTVDFTPTDMENFTVANAMVTLTVLPADPLIDWSTPDPISFGTALGETQLNATAAIDGTFVYTPSAGAVLNPGANQALEVAFTPDDLQNFNPVTAQTTISVLKLDPVITWNVPQPITFGDLLTTEQLNATANVSGSFSYNPPAGAGLGIGDHVLTATFTPTDTATYNRISHQVTITVGRKDPILMWATPEDIVFGAPLGSQQLNASADVPGFFTYDPPQGTLLSAGDGQTLNLTFNPIDTVNYNSASESVTINVKQATSVITWAPPAPVTFGSFLSSRQLNATANVAGSFVYTPDEGSPIVAGDDQPLTVVFTPDNPNFTTETRTVLIDVLRADPQITWASPAPIPYGQPLGSEELNASSVIPGDFAYALGDDSPAEGAVLEVGTGHTLKATFTPTDTDNYNTVSATVTVDVVKASPVITWPTPADIFFGTALNVTDHLNATAGQPGSFEYTPAAGAVLNVGASQTLSVTFTPNDDARQNTVQATVQINVNRAMPEVNWQTPAPIIFGTPLSATQLNASSLISGQFIYSPDLGAILNAGMAQTLSVTFVPDDNISYQNATVEVGLDVLKAQPQITWNEPAAIVLGAALTSAQLNASANISGTFAYTPAAGTILNAGDDQELSVLFSPADSLNYELTAATVSIDVLRKTPAIDWPAPAPISFGVALGPDQLNARTIDGLPGSFAYSPATGTVLNAGAAQVLSVTFTPDDLVNHQPTTVTVQLDVRQADAPVTWNPPATLPYGTPLSLVQYSPSSSIPGSFSFNPPIGTTLRSGSGQSLTATFTPEDAANYKVTVATREVDVLKANLIVRADDKARRVNTPNPRLTATYTGFVNGDTEASLSSPAALTTTANTSSPVGSYDIFASSASHPDYNTVHFKGTLHVTTDLPPSVLIITPAGTAPVGALSNVPVEAQAQDDGAIDRVDFYLGNDKVAEVSSSPYRATIIAIPLGSHTLTAVATDDAGQQTTSAPVLLEATAAVTDVIVNQGGSIDLTIVGESGVGYAVEVSEDLRSWTRIATIVGNGSTQPVLDETVAASVGQRFYRIVQLP